MPIAEDTPLTEIHPVLHANVAAYNDPLADTAIYNNYYNCYITARTAGIAADGSVAAWIAAGHAAPEVRALLSAFGMHGRASQLVPIPLLHATLAAVPAETIARIAGFTLPLEAVPALLPPGGGPPLAAELTYIYNTFAAPGAVSVSGGFVVASKALHCLFPELAPMIDGSHTGLSYFHIRRTTYTPPLALGGTWNAWLGGPMAGVPNPSPRGAGRHRWGSQQFLAAIGINQHIYALWQAAHEHPGLPAFLALDPTPGTTGIPRVIDKALW